MQKKFQSFEPWSCLGSPRHNTKSKSKLHNHEDLVLNFRKPTVPKPFNLNTSLRSSKLKGIYNLRSNKQKNHSISPLQKKKFIRKSFPNPPRPFEHTRFNFISKIPTKLQSLLKTKTKNAAFRFKAYRNQANHKR